MGTDWKKQFEKGKQLVLATSSTTKKPHAIIVLSLGFYEDKLLIADCQMQNTLENLKKNNALCIIGGYYRIKGTAEIFSSGAPFELCKKENKEYSVKHAILVTIQEVVNLDTLEFVL
jgi:hypothetical protein